MCFYLALLFKSIQQNDVEFLDSLTFDGLPQAGIKRYDLSPSTKVSRKQYSMKFHRPPRLRQADVMRSFLSLVILLVCLI